MIICGILGGWELLVIFLALLFIVLPALKMISERRQHSQYTEKLDQLERLERMFRDGAISEREFNRQKRRILKGRS